MVYFLANTLIKIIHAEQLENGGLWPNGTHLKLRHPVFNGSYYKSGYSWIFWCMGCHYAIELASIKSLQMYKLSYNRGFSSLGMFCEEDEPFSGFPDDSNTSATYLNLFQKVRKSYLNPRVVLNRLCVDCLHGGRVSKRIVNVEYRRGKERRVPSNSVHSVGTITVDDGSNCPLHCALNNENPCVEDALITGETNVQICVSVKCQVCLDWIAHRENKICGHWGSRKQGRGRKKRYGRDAKKIYSHPCCLPGNGKGIGYCDRTKSSVVHDMDHDSLHDIVRTPYASEGIPQPLTTFRIQHTVTECSQSGIKCPGRSEVESTSLGCCRERGCNCSSSGKLDSSPNCQAPSCMKRSIGRVEDVAADNSSNHGAIDKINIDNANVYVEHSTACMDSTKSGAGFDSKLENEDVCHSSKECSENRMYFKTDHPNRNSVDSAGISELIVKDSVDYVEKHDYGDGFEPTFPANHPGNGAQLGGSHLNEKVSGKTDGESEWADFCSNLKAGDVGFMDKDMHIQGTPCSEGVPEVSVKAFTTKQGSTEVQCLEQNGSQLDCNVALENAEEESRPTPVSHAGSQEPVVTHDKTETLISSKDVGDTGFFPTDSHSEKEKYGSVKGMILSEKRVTVIYSQIHAKPPVTSVITVEAQHHESHNDTQKCVFNQSFCPNEVTDVAKVPEAEFLKFDNLHEVNLGNQANVQCSGNTDIDLNVKQAMVAPPLKPLISSDSKPRELKEPEVDKVDEVVRRSTWSMEAAPPTPPETLISPKPCVVKLQREPGIDKIVRSAKRSYDGNICYPIFYMGDRIKTTRAKIRHQFPSRKKSKIHARVPIIRNNRNVSEGSVDDITRIDLSDGIELKNFCKLKSINLTESDSDEYSDGWSFSPVFRPSSLSSSSIELDRASSTRTFDEINPPADLVVSENPVPSGVQALNELGFLEHESFQLGKEQPSDSIWSDVLDFGGSEELNVGVPSHQSKDCDLFPLPTSANNACRRKTSFRAKVFGTELMHLKSPRKEDILVSSHTQKNAASAELAKSNKFSKCRVPASWESPRKIPPTVSRNLRVKERNSGVKNRIGDSDFRSSGKQYVSNYALTYNEDDDENPTDESQGIPPDRVGECEFRSDLIRPTQFNSNKYLRKRGRRGRINKLKKRKCCDVLLEQDDCKTSQKSSKKHVKRIRSSPSSCDEITDSSPPDHKKRASKASIKKPKLVFDEAVEADRASRELKHRLSTSWLTKKFRVKKEKNGGGVLEGENHSDSKEDVPTSETLYRDLSTIPYIYKCNLQNKCRKCKNLIPCANANKKFKLFFTLTVGVGRRLCKPLFDTLQDAADDCKISKTYAYIAASAVVSRPTTILIPAYPDVMQNILPPYHSNLLMQLVCETEEMEKQEKKTISELAIAETLQFKRALIAMKSRYPTLFNQDPPQSMQSTPDTSSVVFQSVQSGNQFEHKTSKIISLNCKIDSKFKFAKKSLVSILPKDPNKWIQHNKEDGKKLSDSAETQLNDSEEEELSQVAGVTSPSKDDAAVNPVSGISKSRPDNGCDSVLHSSFSCQTNGVNSPAFENSTVLSTSNGSDNSQLKKSTFQNLAHFPCGSDSKDVAPQILDSFSLTSSSREHVIVHIPECSPLLENETSHDSGEMVGSAQTPSSRKVEDDNDAQPPVICSQSLRDIDQTALSNQLLETRENCEPQAFSNSTEKSVGPQNSIDSLPISEETPDVILVPDKFESIDLTTVEEKPEALTNEPPRWGAICASLPELGFVKVQKISDRLLVFDKAVVQMSDPLELTSIQELNKFLNARLAPLDFSFRSKVALKWILVTSGYLKLKSIPPTNSLFWLPSYSARRTLIDLRNFCKRYGTTQSCSGSPDSVLKSVAQSSSRSNDLMSNGQIKTTPGKRLNMESSNKHLLPPRAKVPKIDKSGKIVRINGQLVVMGTPLKYSSTPKNATIVMGSAGNSASQVSSVGIEETVVSPTSNSVPARRYVVLKGTSSGLRAIQENTTIGNCLVYTKSNEGYVPVTEPTPPKSGVSSKDTSSADSPAKSKSSLLNLDNSPRFVMLSSPAVARSAVTISRKSHPTLKTSQNLTNIVTPISSGSASTAVSVPKSSQCSTIRIPLVSSASKLQSPCLTRTVTKFNNRSTIVSNIRPTLSRSESPLTVVAPRIVSSFRASLFSTLPSNVSPKTVQSPKTTVSPETPLAPSASSALKLTAARKPYKQIMIKPGCIKYVTLDRINPGSTPTTSSTVQKTTNAFAPTSTSEKVREESCQATSSSVSASAALSQKLAEALSRKSVTKPNHTLSPHKNQQILIINKGSAGKVGKTIVLRKE